MKIETPPQWQPNDKLMAFVNQLLSTNEPFALIFSGAPGRGKTALAELIFQALEKQYKPNWFLPSKKLYDKYLSALNLSDANKNVELERIYSYFTMPLFLLDDLGEEPHTDAARAFMSSLFSTQDEALANGQPIRCIITTNLDAPMISERYGERIMSRIYANYTIVSFNGKQDFRQLKRNVVEV